MDAEEETVLAADDDAFGWGREKAGPQNNPQA